MKQDERKIQHKIMAYFREQGLTVLGTANGQFLNTWSAIRERATLGKGLADLFILIPADRSKIDKPILVCCEVKTGKGRATPDQIAFINFINSIQGDTHGFIAHSLQEAKDYIDPMLKDKEPAEDLERFIKNM